ncbi:MAG: hypothetical protein OXI16_09325 [Chloroflexota bacterium]|nr:hypothetical protein [Chloroflexota bacterium]
MRLTPPCPFSKAIVRAMWVRLRYGQPVIATSLGGGNVPKVLYS